MKNNKFELLKPHNLDECNILDEKALNLVKGGVKCRKDYDGSMCGCGYNGPVIKKEAALNEFAQIG